MAKMKAKKLDLKNDDPIVGSGLRLREEEFCKAFTSPDRELFGNGVKSYLEVYGPQYRFNNKRNMSYDVGAVLASKLLKKVKIIQRINELLEEGGFNESNVDKQHLFLINQHGDLKVKLGAIKEFNTLKKRVDNASLVVVVDPTKKGSFNKALEYLHSNK